MTTIPSVGCGAYLIESHENELGIVNNATGYRLCFELTNDRPYHLHFKVPMPDYKTENCLIVTGRHLCEYPANACEALERDDARLIEVGAGLGALVPNLAGRGKRPIAIDPFDYALAEDMLTYARDVVNPGPYFVGLIDTLLLRAQVMQDKSKITLINTTLGRAVREHPEIKGIADVVVDCVGAMEYCDAELLNVRHTKGANVRRELESFVEEAERSLLKPGGKLIVAGSGRAAK
jgi:SAM-dependent methyltransferase